MNNMKGGYYIFLYCDYKKNGKFHDMISKECRYVGDAKIIGFDMYLIDGTYPTITNGTGTIFGELYRFYNSSILSRLDVVKSPDIRKLIRIEEVKSENIMRNKFNSDIKFPPKAWVYGRGKSKITISNNDYQKVESGIWKI